MLDLAERRNNYKICQWDVRELVAQAQEAAPLPPETVPLAQRWQRCAELLEQQYSNDRASLVKRYPKAVHSSTH